MGDRPGGRAAADWPLAYLIITAISVGIIIGVRHGISKPITRYELVPIAFIVVLYTVTSAVHYYQTTRQKPPR
jgi:small basic protein